MLMIVKFDTRISMCNKTVECMVTSTIICNKMKVSGVWFGNDSDRHTVHASSRSGPNAGENCPAIISSSHFLSVNSRFGPLRCCSVLSHVSGAEALKSTKGQKPLRKPQHTKMKRGWFRYEMRSCLNLSGVLILNR